MKIEEEIDKTFSLKKTQLKNKFTQYTILHIFFQLDLYLPLNK